MSPHAGFSPRARTALALANEEANAWRQEHIGSEHILVGILAEGSGTGARALAAAEVDLTRLRATLGTMLKRGPRVVSSDKRPQTPRAMHAIERATREAEALGHREVRTGHLLLGILAEPRCTAVAALVALGIDFAALRARVLDELGIEPSAPDRAAAEQLATFLALRDTPCPACGYNLRGLRSPTCPECRQRVELQVALADPLGLSFALAMLGLGACGAGAAFLLIAVCGISLWHGIWVGDELHALVSAPLAILSLDGLLLYTLGSRAGRRWFARLGPRRAHVAIACWAASLLAFGVWFTIAVALA